MTTVNPEADAKDPSRHFGVVIGSAYLVFLFFPIGSVLGATTGGNTVLGLAVIVVFAIIYISLFWASRDLGFPVQRLYPRVMGGLMAMTVITGVMVTWIGPELTGLATFIVGSLLYVLPIPWGYYAAMAAVGLTVVALLATDGLREPKPCTRCPCGTSSPVSTTVVTSPMR